jgi:hypothetical protein
MADQAQSGYYQAIAREFLRLRGAPFFLSPKDIAVVAGWEEEGVPLEVVLEGVGRAFESGRGPSRGRKGFTVAHCQAQVRKAMAQHVDRAAGRRRREAKPRSEKSARARSEAEAFLRRLPPGDDALRSLYEAAIGLLARPSPDEAALERIDDDVDAALWDRSSRDERDALKRRMTRDLAGKSGADATTAVRTRLVKASREGLRIPYVSLFYY